MHLCRNTQTNTVGSKVSLVCQLGICRKSHRRKQQAIKVRLSEKDVRYEKVEGGCDKW